MNRYRAKGLQGTTEPGSDGRVMANKLGLTDQESLDEAETELLFKLYEEVFDSLEEDQPLDTALLKQWHHRWRRVRSLLSWKTAAQRPACYSR